MKFVVIVFGLFIHISLIGQSAADVVPDKRLLDVYTPEYINNLSAKSPHLIQRLNYYLDHSYYVSKVHKHKRTNVMDTIKIQDLEDINILALERDLGIGADRDEFTSYKIEGSDLFLIYLSAKRFTESYNKHFRRLHR